VIAAARSAPPRSTLGRYRLICELGSGGMAHVYLARTTGLAGFTKLAVLKVMRDELAQEPEAVKLFLGEARLAARFNHPNVVQTTEVGEDAGCYFISMEYLEGLSLGTLLGRTLPLQLPLAVRLEIACQMLEGLGYLHGLSDFDASPLHLVHRDISPSNVFVTFEGTVKLLDFGVAKAAGVTEVSAVGSFKGKLGYAAPEQLRGQSDARSDIFTAGLLLWEMFSYRRLSPDRTQTEIVRGRLAGTDLALMRTRGPEVAAPLLEICLKAAALRPEDRYQSASALRDAIRSYMVEHALHASSEQLRLLLAERFDVVRQATRKRIDQRVKEVQREDARLLRGLGPESHSSQYGSVTSPRPASKVRPFLVPAGGAVLALVAAFSGAWLARSAGSAAANQPNDAAPARPPVADLGHSSENATSGGALVAQTRPVVERGTTELDTQRTRSDERTAHGAAAAKLPRRPDSRTLVRPHSPPRGLKASIAQTTEAASGDGLPAPARSVTTGLNEPPDFAHRGSSKVARPIDTSSPYSN
jgi:serine/threonine protein kinase